MKKILYLTTIPWGWIKQRPQFLAEYLSENFVVDVRYRTSTRVSRKVLINEENRTKSNLLISSFKQIPFEAIPLIRLLPLSWINKMLLRLQLPSFEKYDYIWYASSWLYSLTKHNVVNTNKIIYDCMDDMLEFPKIANNPSLKMDIMKKENFLLRDADHIFCSAEYLASKIVKRANISRNKISIVNNAIELPNLNKITKSDGKMQSIVDFLDKTPRTLLYIGTIEKWFDFDLILNVLNKCPDFHLILLGPSSGAVPGHERIHHLGVVQHDDIFEIMPHASALVMPFVLNELIRAVNPVKLYEYIYSGVPVIATKYGETIKFMQHVCLYENEDDFISYLNNLDNIRKSIEINKCREFVKQNTWQNRAAFIKGQLLKL